MYILGRQDIYIYKYILIKLNIIFQCFQAWSQIRIHKYLF